MILRVKITPIRACKGRVSLPGDKSISHRAAILASLAASSCRISNFSTSADCSSTLKCLRQLGVRLEQQNLEVTIEGRAKSGFHAPAEQLDCGNSGSTMRMLAGLLAGYEGKVVMTGDDSLRSRTMTRIIEPLELMGVSIESANGLPPLTIRGSNALRPICYQLPVASAQVKSAVLIAGVQSTGRTKVIERLGTTRDHTERMLSWLGVPLKTTTSNDKKEIVVDGPAAIGARDIRVPGDISSASFLIAAAALLEGSSLEVENVGLNPTRTQFLTTLQALGFAVTISGFGLQCNEPVGSVTVSGTDATEIRPQAGANLLGGALIPQVIDELPLLAVVGSQISGGIRICDAKELRLKESDRIRATVTNLRAMGAKVEEFDSGLTVGGPTQLHGARLETLGDHRIAMAFTVAALLADTESEIVGAECVKISFPNFFELLESLAVR